MINYINVYFVMRKIIMGKDKDRSEHGTYVDNASDFHDSVNIDNRSRKVDKGLGSTPEKARDDAWKRAKHNS